MGHLRQEKQHLQSTSSSTLPSNTVTSSSDLVSIDKDFFPPREQKTKDVIFAITQYSEKEVAAADLTGRFPYRSSRGHQYVMIMYHWDCNVIWGQPLKKRSVGDIVEAYNILMKKKYKWRLPTQPFHV